MVAPSKRLKYLWLLLPLAAIVEPLLGVYQAHRFPSVREWIELRPHIAALKRASDLVVIAPDWAEPIARHAFGDELMPIVNCARADEAPFERAIEVDALSEHAPRFASWPILSDSTFGHFHVRVRKNPGHQLVGFTAIDHVRPPDLRVFEERNGRQLECPYTARASPSAGGLLGHPTFPRERFACGTSEANFVGITVIDDQRFAPRRCIWANSASGDTITLVFSDVLLQSVIHGYVGLPYFTFRDEGWRPIAVSVSVDHVKIGSYRHVPESGWQSFEFPTPQSTGQRAQLEFVIEDNGDPREHELCLYADVR